MFVAQQFYGHQCESPNDVGKLDADLLIDGKTDLPNVNQDDFRFSRFEEGDMLLSLNPYEGAGEMR